MGNVISYLKWRGDITFQEHGFCEADNLVLSAFAYLDFSGIVPGDKNAPGIALREAASAYQITGKSTKSHMSETLDMLLAEMANSSRYADAILSCYVHQEDDTLQTQFAAIKIELDDGSVYLAFRGTDETISGWREDFRMSYEVVPAQKAAISYLDMSMTKEKKIYRLGGHSKGGNLALFAAAHCPREKQEQILSVYNNDGPGISPERLDVSGYAGIRGKLTCIVPQFCVVGKLYEPDVVQKIVKSSAKGILQHDILTWEIEGDQLCFVEENDEKSRFYNQVFAAWIESADTEQKKIFTRDFFDALEADGATTMPQVAEGGIDGFGTILLSVVSSESKTKIVAVKLIQSFLKQLRKMSFRSYLHSRTGMIAMGAILSGILFLLAPQFAIQSIGIILSFLGLLWSAGNVIHCAEQTDMEPGRKRKRLIVYLVGLSICVFLISHHTLLLISGNLLLGALFLTAAVLLFRNITRTEKKNIVCGVKALFAIMLILLGCVAMATPERAFSLKMISAGSALILYGLGNMICHAFYAPSAQR